MHKKLTVLVSLTVLCMIVVSGCGSMLIDRDYETLKGYYEVKNVETDDDYSYTDTTTKEQFDGKLVNIWLTVTKELKPVQMLDIAKGLEQEYGSVETGVTFINGDGSENNVRLLKSKIATFNTDTKKVEYITDDAWIEKQNKK